MDRIRILIKNMAKEIEAAGFGKDLGKDVKEIQNYLESSIKSTTHGVALFYCLNEGVQYQIQTWAPFRDQWTLSSTPNVRQLVRILDDYENTLAVIVSSEKGRIIRITPEATAEETIITEDFPGRHEQGGWAQARYQRHVEEHASRHLKTVAEAVSKDWDSLHFSSVIVAGQEHIVAQFVRLLPKRISDCIVGTPNLEIKDSLDRIVDSVVHIIRDAEESRAHKELNELQSSGELISGWEQVTPAVNQSRISTLYIKAGYNHQGWTCPKCDVIGEEMPHHCPICGDTVQTTNLVDAAVTKVEKDRGRVEICMNPDLTDIAGRLRF